MSYVRTKSIDKKRTTFELTVESLDDLWVCYNIILSGDFVSSKTTRRIRHENEVHSDTAERRPLFLEIRAEKIRSHSFVNRLRVTGETDVYFSYACYKEL